MKPVYLTISRQADEEFADQIKSDFHDNDVAFYQYSKEKDYVIQDVMKNAGGVVIIAPAGNLNTDTVVSGNTVKTGRGTFEEAEYALKNNIPVYIANENDYMYYEVTGTKKFGTATYKSYGNLILDSKYLSDSRLLEQLERHEKEQMKLGSAKQYDGPTPPQSEARTNKKSLFLKRK